MIVIFLTIINNNYYHYLQSIHNQKIHKLFTIYSYLYCKGKNLYSREEQMFGEQMFGCDVVRHKTALAIQLNL